MLSVSRAGSVAGGGGHASPVCDTVERYVERQLTRWRDRPADVPGAEDVAAAVAAAGAAGLLAHDGIAGQWWAAGEDAGPGDCWQIPEILAAYHAGMAFHLHRLALGEWLQSRLGLGDPPGRVLPWLPDGHALSATAFARFMARGVVPAADAALLPVPGVMLRWQAAPVWDALLVPVRDAGGIRWHRVSRNAWAVTARPTHGLDGTLAHHALLADASAGSSASLDTADAAQVLIELLGRDAMALMALALGATRRALALARTQADTRVQGGRLIRDHAAVQGLLADGRIAVECTHTLLSSLATPPDCINGLRHVYAQRIVAHELLCRGANAALQVFGGMGYMRDVGLERAVRDNNQLRVTAGAPGDLKLFITRAEQQS